MNFCIHFAVLLCFDELNMGSIEPRRFESLHSNFELEHSNFSVGKPGPVLRANFERVLCQFKLSRGLIVFLSLILTPSPTTPSGRTRAKFVAQWVSQCTWSHQQSRHAEIPRFSRMAGSDAVAGGSGASAVPRNLPPGNDTLTHTIT